MTSDIIQNLDMVKKNTPPEGLFESTGNIVGFLKKHDSQKHDNETTELLKTAYRMLCKTEKELSEKEERIKDLEKLLTIDELTQTGNRRGFYSRFEGELDRTNRGENKGGLLIIIDLDHFKSINDKFGHQAGDEALKTVGAFLKSNVRPMDMVARMGGDEFIILMPNTDIAKAMKRARKIGNSLNNLSFKWNETIIHIHASLGLKEYEQGDTIEAIIEQADKGMYENKKIRKYANN